MKVNSLAESLDVFQHLTSNLIKSWSFTVCFTHLFKQHGQATVADEAKFYERRHIANR